MKPPHLVQSWSFSTCPGRKESLEASSPSRRVWVQDTGTLRKWNRDRKAEFYTAQDQALMSQASHEEKFNSSDVHYRQWTHLLEGGTRPGGIEEKLDYFSRSSRIYKGKYEDVRHSQRVVKSGPPDPETGKSWSLHRDERRAFDNRLKDDCVRYLDQLKKSSSAFDLYKPTCTSPVAALGEHFVQR